MFNWKDKSDEQIAKEVIANQGRLEGMRDIHDPLREEIEKIFNPYDWCLRDYDPDNLQFNPKVFTDTPGDAKNKFVDGFTANTVSSETFWLRFATSKQELMKDDDVKKYLQKLEEQTKFGYGQSNFYTSYPLVIDDAATIGPGLFLPEEDKVKGRVVFKTFKHWDCYIDDDEFGEIDVFHRKLRMSAKNLLEKFGKDVLPDEIVDHALGKDNKDPFKKYDLIHAMYFNGTRRPGGLHNLDLPYISFYVMPNVPGAIKSGPLLLEKKGIRWFVIDLRINKLLGQVYNTTRTLATRALISSGIVNALSRDNIRASALAVNPPTIGPVGLRGKLHLNPGGRSWYDAQQNSGPQEVKNLMDKLSWNVGEAQISKLDRLIEDKFYNRLWEVWANVENMSQMTIFQAGQITGEKAVMLSRIIQAGEGMLDKATQVIWDYENESGRFPPENEIPDVLKLDENKSIVNVYEGHLSRQKKTMNENRDTLNGLAASKVVTDMFPDSKDIVKDRELHERVAISAGLIQEDFRSDQEMEEFDRHVAELEQQQAQAEQIQAASQAAPGLSKPIEDGSPLDIAGIGT